MAWKFTPVFRNFFFLFTGPSQYVKKEKLKRVEEFIDVVGDFGPGSIKQDDSRFQADERFGGTFDVGSVQSDSMRMELPDQAIMMPPQPGKRIKVKNKSIFVELVDLPAGQDENDSQQAAEAMIQLGYYTTKPQNPDESLVFDPNYDPYDFLMKKDPAQQRGRQ